MRIEVVYGEARRDWSATVEVDEGAVVAAAIDAAFESAGFADLDRERFVAVSVFGEIASLQRPLADGDRVELLRPLRLDPMQARRSRSR